MNLKNKIAIVTGAGSGIGEATAIELAKHGCTPVLVGRTGKYYQSQSKTSPTVAAKAIRQAIEKERFVTVTPSRYKLLIAAHDFFPGLFSKQLQNVLRPHFK